MPWGPRSVQPYPSPPTFLPSKPPERLPPPAARSSPSSSSTRRSFPPPAARRPRAPTESLKWRVRCPEDQGRFRQANEADGGGGRAWWGFERESLANEAGHTRRSNWRNDQALMGCGGARSGPGEHDYQPTRHFYPRERSPERERRREESSGTRWAPYRPPLPLAPASLPERPPSLLRVTPAGTFKDAFILLPAALASTRCDPATRPYKHRGQQTRPPAQRAVWPSPPRERRDDRPSQVAPVRSRFVPRTPASTADSSWSDGWLPRDPQPAPRPPQPGPPLRPPPARQPLPPAGPRRGYAHHPLPPPPRQQQAVAGAPIPSPRKRPLVAPFVPVGPTAAQRPLRGQAQPHPHPPSSAPMDPRMLVQRAKDPPAPSLPPQTRLILGSLALLPPPAASRPSSSSSSTTATSHLGPATPPPSVTLVALSPSPSPTLDPVALRSRLTPPSDPNPPWLAAALYGPSFEDMEWRKALHDGKKRAREDEEERGGKRRRTDEGREESDEVWLDLGAWEARWKKRAERERAGGGRR